MSAAIKKLETMVGKAFLFRGKEVVITNWRNDEGEVVVITGKRPYAVKPAELGDFLMEFHPVDITPAVMQHKGGSGLQAPETVNALGSLRDILLENIDKVRKNRDYIEQSREINANVKSIIDLAKTEMEAIRLTNGR